MADFFISYNGDDTEWALWIAAQLKAAGRSVIVHAWDFRPGANFILEMDRAMKEASRTIAVLSPSYLGALYTHPEWAAAFARDPTGTKRSLVPVRVRRVELSGLLGQIVYIDLAGKSEDAARQALLEGVAERVPETAARRPGSAAAPFPGAIPSPPRVGLPNGGDPVSAAVDLAGAGRVQDAIEALLAAIEQEPGRALAHYNLALLFDALGKTADAVRHYRRAIALGDETGDAHSNLGLIYLRSGETEAAAREFRSALAVYPAHASALGGLGSVAVREKRYDDAVSLYRQVVHARPDDVVSRNNLADALLQAGRPEEARIEIAKALLEDPLDAVCRRTEQEILEALR